MARKYGWDDVYMGKYPQIDSNQHQDDCLRLIIFLSSFFCFLCVCHCLSGRTPANCPRARTYDNNSGSNARGLVSVGSVPKRALAPAFSSVALYLCLCVCLSRLVWSESPEVCRW